MEGGLAERQAKQWVEMVEAILEGIEDVQAEDAGDLEDSRTLEVWESHFWGFLDRLDLQSRKETQQKQTQRSVKKLVRFA